MYSQYIIEILLKVALNTITINRIYVGPRILSEADLEGAFGACAPLKFAKHMLYNVN